jgi:hypothetical protein
MPGQSNRRSSPYLKLDIVDELPTAQDEMRGQIRCDPGTTGVEDRIMFCGMRDDGTIGWYNLTGLAVQEADVTVQNVATILDFFGNHFDLTTSGNTEVNIALALASIRERMVLFTNVSQSSANLASNSSTTVYNDGALLDLQLPDEGTWTVIGLGGMLLENASGNVNLRLMIEGDAGTARTLDATTEQMFVDNHAVSGLTYAGTSAGLVECRIEYKPASAGTANARNPWLFLIGLRTA